MPVGAVEADSLPMTAERAIAERRKKASGGSFGAITGVVRSGVRRTRLRSAHRAYLFLVDASSSSGSAVLRRAEPVDAPAIGVVFSGAVRASGIRPPDTPRQPEPVSVDWAALIDARTRPYVVTVAVGDAGDIIGFSAVDTRLGELFLLFVHPAHAHRGIGRALLGDAHRVLGDAGHREVFLYVEEDNTDAIRVYTGAGYRADGTVRESYPPGAIVREFRMVRIL